MRKVKSYKCPICKKTYDGINTWGNHMIKIHPTEIPEGFTPARYFYYLQTGKSHGNCIVCQTKTRWNESTYKYERFCTNPKCKEQYREIFKKRMINKHGKVHLLDDPDMQRKMLKNRKISGVYSFSDGIKVEYVAQYEKDFLMMLDSFGFSGNDIMGPSPHTYNYTYKNSQDKENEGEKFYIPDFYLPSLNLEIEIKSSTNTHHKIQRVDKVKEAIKDKMMSGIRGVNYIKLSDKDYAPFFNMLIKLKDEFISSMDENR